MAENGEKGKLLSPALMGFLRRRAMEVCGLLLILAGGALTAMLFSPGRLDPSWSAFSPGPVNNWFGPVGATIAGGLRTSLGAASFFATLLPLGWGYRLLRKQEIGLGFGTGLSLGSLIRRIRRQLGGGAHGRLVHKLVRVHCDLVHFVEEAAHHVVDRFRGLLLRHARKVPAREIIEASLLLVAKRLLDSPAALLTLSLNAYTRGFRWRRRRVVFRFLRM